MCPFLLQTPLFLFAVCFWTLLICVGNEDVCLSICLSVYCQPAVVINFQEYSTDWLEEVTTSVGWRSLSVENGEQFAISIGTNVRPRSFADS